MSFVDRLFPDITRDILTNLTQGVTQEIHRVDFDATARPPVVPDIVLERRPVRRVSIVQGFIAPVKSGDPPVPFTFTLNDYQLVPNPRANARLPESFRRSVGSALQRHRVLLRHVVVR